MEVISTCGCRALINSENYLRPGMIYEIALPRWWNGSLAAEHHKRQRVSRAEGSNVELRQSQRQPHRDKLLRET
jgi:hypothetical protein